MVRSSIYSILFLCLLFSSIQGDQRLHAEEAVQTKKKTSDKPAKAQAPAKTQDGEKGWTQLFDGKSFGKWKKATENEKSWQIEDGVLVCRGPRCHLFYMGETYKNFELKVDVKTEPGSNSGIYFHTKYLAKGWPKQGYESQVNISHHDPQKTGGLYNTAKVLKAPAQDNKWWTQHIIVNGKHIVVKIDGKTVVDYIEPDDKKKGAKLSEGNFALQAHDPKSVVRFKNIRVKKLP